jgi:hypothetical protein
VIVGTDRTDGAASREVRKDSDALLEAVRKLHDLERVKRSQQLSSPEFHEMAREITQRSREVFRIAAEEEKAGNEVQEPQDATTDDIRA